MSIQHSILSGLTGNGNVTRLAPARNKTHRIITLVVVLALALLAAAFAVKPDPASNPSSTPIQAAQDPKASTGSAYFPAQYKNQATESSEHIQAY